MPKTSKTGRPTGTIAATTDADRRREINSLVGDSKELVKTVRFIESLGKDPLFILALDDEEEKAELYSEGARTKRKSFYYHNAVSYLFNVDLDDENKMNKTIASLGGRTQGMVSWFVGFWDDYHRPKTWVDMLSPAQKKTWKEAKTKYNRVIERENEALEKAKEVYKKEVQRVQLEQEKARTTLRNLLTSWGVTDAPIMKVRTEEDEFEDLNDELAALGIVVAPPARAGDDDE